MQATVSSRERRRRQARTGAAAGRRAVARGILGWVARGSSFCSTVTRLVRLCARGERLGLKRRYAIGGSAAARPHLRTGRLSASFIRLEVSAVTAGAGEGQARTPPCPFRPCEPSPAALRRQPWAAGLRLGAGLERALDTAHSGGIPSPQPCRTHFAFAMSYWRAIALDLAESPSSQRELVSRVNRIFIRALASATGNAPQGRSPPRFHRSALTVSWHSAGIFSYRDRQRRGHSMSVVVVAPLCLFAPSCMRECAPNISKRVKALEGFVHQNSCTLEFRVALVSIVKSNHATGTNSISSMRRHIVTAPSPDARPREGGARARVGLPPTRGPYRRSAFDPGGLPPRLLPGVVRGSRPFQTIPYANLGNVAIPLIFCRGMDFCSLVRDKHLDPNGCATVCARERHRNSRKRRTAPARCTVPNSRPRRDQPADMLASSVEPAPARPWSM